SFRARGLRPGDRVALIEGSYPHLVEWLELDRAQLIALVPAQGEPDAFWKSGPAIQERVFETFRTVGARWVFADAAPNWADMSGWQKAAGGRDSAPPGRQT